VPSEFVAAIDLGSNSFHMIVARIANGHVQILDRLREMVQLAAGLDGRNRLSPASQQRALDCLARFGQRLRHIPPARLRIVGTNTLRQARNSAEFVARAEQLLGHRVEIVSGQEEARLIYLGVAHSVGDVAGQRLVIDIGGGSTELIVGEQFDPLHLASLRMGCVSLSRSCFADGRVTAGRLREAELLVQLNLEPFREEYLARGWEVTTGASGSIKAIQGVLTSEGWSREGIYARRIAAVAGGFARGARYLRPWPPVGSSIPPAPASSSAASSSCMACARRSASSRWRYPKGPCAKG
jgi:exopolyphosphatase/guanosine-5'-triphosphate,3'-diphosphate pyrophosphatase